MSSEDVAQLQDIAAGSVVGATGAVNKIRGATVARNGAGDFTVTIDAGDPQNPPFNLAGPDLDVQESLITVQPIDTTPIQQAIQHTSDTAKQLLFFTPDGAPADPDAFEFRIRRNTLQGGAGDDVSRIQELAGGMVDIIAGPAIDVLKARGCVVARTGVGVYTVTLDPNAPGGPGVLAAESISKVNIEDATSGLCAVLEHNSATLKTIRIFTDADVAAAADANFSFAIGRLLG